MKKFRVYGNRSDEVTELEQQTPVREYDLIEQPIFVY